MNDVAINYVKTKLKTWRGNGIVLDFEFPCNRFCKNIFDFIVPEGLKGIYHSIARIHIAVRYVKSLQGQETFKTFVKHEKIE